MLKKIFNKKNLFVFILLTMVLSTIFIIVRIILAPSEPTITAPFEKLKSDYVLMLLQCILGIGALFLPAMLNRKWGISLPNNIFIVYVIFLYCAIYLGEVRSFYYNIPHWDTILHTCSGAMLGALGFSVVNLLNDATKTKVQLSPMFVAMFAFCFAVSLGVVWEIYEFSADAILLTNMQKFGLEDGTPFIGRAALNDTMKDLIVDTIGAFTMSLIGYISIRKKPNWIEKFDIRQVDAK